MTGIFMKPTENKWYVKYHDNDVIEKILLRVRKRFYKYKDKIILHPENDTMQDLTFDNVTILGVVKGLMRKF